MNALLRKELLALLRDGRLVALSLAVVALCGAVYGVESVRAAQAQAERAAVNSATRAQWDGQGDAHPHRAAHFGVYAFAPGSALAAFDPGIDAHVGRALWLEPHRRNFVRFSPAADEVYGGRLGDFAPAFVLAVLLPLLVVAAAYGCVASERETGTLRLARALLARPARLVWAKFAATLLAVAGLASLAFVPVLLLPSGPGDAADTLVRWAALYLVHLAYLAIFVALAVAVSTAARTARQALVVLLAAWLAFALVLPRAGAAAADASVELPTPEAFWAAIRRDYREGLPGDGTLAERSRAFDAELLRTHGVERLEDLPFGALAVRRLHRDAYADRVHALHFDELWRRYALQESVLRRVALASPTVAVQLLSARLAGTDLAHRRHFEDAAEAYRQRFNTHLDRWDAANTRGVTSFEERYAGDALWRSVPPFEYRPPSAGFALRAGAIEIAILAGWLAGALGLLAVCARRWRT